MSAGDDDKLFNAAIVKLAEKLKHDLAQGGDYRKAMTAYRKERAAIYAAYAALGMRRRKKRKK